MELSIIIVNYRTPELILECLKTIYDFTKTTSFEIIIIENGAKYDDEALIKSQFPDVRWYKMEKNIGYGRACNQGMKLAKADYFLLLNSDIQLFDSAIDICFERLKSHNEIIAAGAYQFSPNFSPQPFHHTTTFRRDFWIVPPSVRKYLSFIIPQKQYADPEQVDYISAAFMMLRQDSFTKTGGFDEEFFLYGEDVEWGFRLSALGKLVVFKDCKIIHIEWGSKPERHQENKNLTYVNRFDKQIHLSNLAWIRKQYGWWYFVALMLHYWSLIPIFYLFKFLANLSKFQSPFANFENQKNFRDTIMIFSKYFWRILLKKPTFYQINEN